MTAAKTVLQKHKDQAAKSTNWFGKWIPDNFTKKAKEAFKLLERAIFSEEYVDEKEQGKIKKLENQLKSLQDKVDQLVNVKPTKPASTPSTQSVVTKTSSKDKTKVSSHKKETSTHARIQIRAPDSPKQSNKKVTPPPPPPVKVASVTSSSIVTATSGHTAPPRPPPPTQPAAAMKALPFSASDLQGFSFKTRSQTGSTPVKPVLSASVAISAVGRKSPARSPVVRAAMKPFSSTDLRLVKLKNKTRDISPVDISSAVSNSTGGNKPPKTPSNKSHGAKSSKPAMSMQSAIKNALKSKFHKAQGSPRGKSDDEDEDADWSK